MIKHLLLSLLILLSLSECTSKNDPLKILDEAEAALSEKPAVAGKILEQITNPSNLADSLQARYYLLHVKSRIFSNQPLLSDSLLDYSINYFRQSSDKHRLQEALYYQSNLLTSKKQFVVSTQYLKEATDLAKEMHNPAFEGICEIQTAFNYKLQGQPDSAAAFLNKGLLHAKAGGDAYTETLAWFNLGQLSEANEQAQKAIEYYQKAIKTGTKHGYKELLLNLYQQLTRLYENSGNYAFALNCNDSVRKYRESRNDIPVINLKKAVLWSKQYQLDSAIYYADIAQKSNDSFVSELANSLLSKLNRQQGKNLEAWRFVQKYEYSFEAFSESIEAAAVKQKYQQARLEIENSQLKIKKKEHDFWLLSIVFGVFLLSAGFYIAFQRYRYSETEQKRRMQEELIKNKSEKLHQENKLLKQEQEISLLREKEALLRESLFRRIHFFEKIPSLQNSEQTDEPVEKHFRKILLTDSDWEELLQNMNEVYPGFTRNLTNLYPELDKDDLLFCCLLKINVNLQDLSDIYCLSKAAITKRKYRIKKDKLHVTESSVSLDDFLKSI